MSGSDPIRVTCAVILSEGAILVTQRGPKMKHAGKWEFPGGKTEPGEDDEACIHREIAEELGLSIRLTGRLPEVTHRYGDTCITLVPFLAELVDGTISLTEHQAFLWLAPGELNQLDWAEADLPVVDEVLNRFR